MSERRLEIRSCDSSSAWAALMQLLPRLRRGPRAQRGRRPLPALPRPRPRPALSRPRPVQAWRGPGRQAEQVAAQLGSGLGGWRFCGSAGGLATAGLLASPTWPWCAHCPAL